MSRLPPNCGDVSETMSAKNVVPVIVSVAVPALSAAIAVVMLVPPLISSTPVPCASHTLALVESASTCMA